MKPTLFPIEGSEARTSSGCAMDYARSFTEGKNDQKEVTRPFLVTSGFLIWEDNPASWGGPWIIGPGEGKTAVLVLVEDHSNRYPAPRTRDQMVMDYRVHSENSAYFFPERVKKITGIPVQGNTYNGSLVSSSDVSYQEKQILLDMMTHEELWFREESISKRVAAMVRDIEGYATYENPITISLHGNDDTSMSRHYQTTDIAGIALENLILSPTWESVKHYIYH